MAEAGGSAEVENDRGLAGAGDEPTVVVPVVADLDARSAELVLLVGIAAVPEPVAAELLGISAVGGAVGLLVELLRADGAVPPADLRSGDGVEGDLHDVVPVDHAVGRVGRPVVGVDEGIEVVRGAEVAPHGPGLGRRDEARHRVVVAVAVGAAAGTVAVAGVAAVVAVTAVAVRITRVAAVAVEDVAAGLGGVVGTAGGGQKGPKAQDHHGRAHWEPHCFVC